MIRGIVLSVKDFCENTIFGGMILVVVLTAFIIGGMAIVNHYAGYYTQYGIVYITDVDETVIVDSTGNAWAIDATDKFNEGDTVKIKFHDNGTDYTVEDDIIVSVEKVK